MNNKLYFAMALMLLIPTTYGKQLVDLKPVPLIDFMQNDLLEPYPVNILVPKAYQGFEFVADEPGKYFWMRPKDAKKAEKHHDLPTNKGFMYGKITMNVAYDAGVDQFVGIEDEVAQTQVTNYFEDFSMDRVLVNGHPILMAKMVHKESKQPTYLMYIATKVSSNVVVIAYIPPKYSIAKGDFVWAQQLTLFNGSSAETDGQDDKH